MNNNNNNNNSNSNNRASTTNKQSPNWCLEAKREIFSMQSVNKWPEWWYYFHSLSLVVVGVDVIVAVLLWTQDNEMIFQYWSMSAEQMRDKQFIMFVSQAGALSPL